MDISYRNPFSEYNANAMSGEKILDYWCSPLGVLDSQMDEQNMLKEPMPIVFMGGRGSGKTMLLKYYSYEVQKGEAFRDKDNKGTIIDHLKEKGGVGIYLRLDGPSLRTFEGSSIPSEQWTAIFIHNFELQVCKQYISIIKDLIELGELDKVKIESGFVKAMALKFGMDSEESLSITNIKQRIEEEIEFVSRYRGKVLFSNDKFDRPIMFETQKLSFEVAKLAKGTIEEFGGDNFNFVILLDEYENYLVQQQRVVNSLIKFHEPGITFRIGMRLEGFHTFATSTCDEYISEKRDYKKFEFENMINNKERYQAFLFDIARNRLKEVPAFSVNNYLDIEKFLGKIENLEDEAKQLVDGRTKHFSLLKKKEEIDAEEVASILAYPHNPLLEMLNILWVLRKNDPEIVRQAMNDYLSGKINELSIKYGRDYVDKYKMSLMYVLASRYRSRKLYYSFNTFCYLSSGIIGNFIELCRRTFDIAYFEDKDLLLKEGTISITFQNRAALELARTELEMISRISDHGDRLYILAKNLGNLFSRYHKDVYMRYPETIQFSFDMPAIKDAEIRRALEKALEWSVIQRKPDLQQKGIGEPKDDIYLLNRLLSPIFGISYRVRGGFSEVLSEEQIAEMMSAAYVPKAIFERKVQPVQETKTSKLTDFFGE